jgi:uncharacterized protein YjiS (DUF1127 family)
MMIKDPQSSSRFLRKGRMPRVDCKIALRRAYWQYLRILIRDLLKQLILRSRQPLMHPAWLIHPIQWVQRRLRSRAGERRLMELDDHALRDIGLTRSKIHAAAYGLLEPEPAIEPTSIEPKGPGPIARDRPGARPAPSTLVSRAARLVALAAAGLAISAGPEAWADDQGEARLPTIDDLPPGVVRVSPSPPGVAGRWARISPGMREHWPRVSPPVPGMGEHWARPEDLPLGPIYCVMDDKVIGVEFMVAQEALLMGRSFKRLRLGMKGKLPPVDHLSSSTTCPTATRATRRRTTTCTCISCRQKRASPK